MTFIKLHKAIQCSCIGTICENYSFEIILEKNRITRMKKYIKTISKTEQLIVKMSISAQFIESLCPLICE